MFISPRDHFQNWNNTSYLLTIIPKLLLPVCFHDFSAVERKDSIVCCLRFILETVDMRNSLVKIDLEFQRNPAGIPAWTNLEFQEESRWNPLESSGIIAGIPPEFQWNSTCILAEFQLEFLKIQDGILMELLPAFRRHSTGILHTTPARVSLEFYRNSRPISSQNPLESSRIIAGIPPEFQWNSTSILVEFQPEILKIQDAVLLELLVVFRWHSTLYSSWISTCILPDLDIIF